MRADQLYRISTWLKEGVAHHQAGNLQQAERSYRQILGLDPRHPAAHNNLGDIAFRLRRFSPAGKHFQQALAGAPGTRQYAENLAKCQYILGDWEALRAMGEGPHAGSATLSLLMSRAFGVRHGQKVFCVGCNKTGTTSIERALADLGFRMGLQSRGERLARDWRKQDFRRIVQLAETADAFQDIPFSLPGTYRALDSHFPGAKFILTIRDDPEQWYRSITSFHSKIMTGGTRLPMADDLRKFEYGYPGFSWEICQWVFGATEESPYDKGRCIDSYMRHNHAVERYFKDRPQDLLVINVSQPDAMRRLCDFLGREWKGQQVPHLNKT